MRTKQSFLLLLLFSFTQTAFSQSFSIELPGKTPIEKKRLQLFKAVKANDKQQATELVQTLSEMVDSTQLSIYPAELVMVWYWTGQYQQILTLYNTTAKDPLAYDFRLGAPEADRLYFQWPRVLIENKGQVQQQLTESALTPEEKEFLSINLDFLTTRKFTFGKVGKEHNERCEAFAKQYLNSPYKDYVMRSLYQVWETARARFFFGLDAGYPLFSGTLSNTFDGQFQGAVLADYSFKRHAIITRLGFGSVQATDSVRVDSGAWFSGANALMFHVQIGYGYHFRYGKNFGVTPYAALGIVGINSSNEDDDKPNLEGSPSLGSGYSISAGVQSDIKLFDFAHRSDADNVYSLDRIALRLRYNYGMLLFSGDNDRFNSSLHEFSAGLVWFIHASRPNRLSR